MSSIEILKKEKKFLLFIFFFSFFVRALFFFFFLSKSENYWTADSAGYHDVAVQISKGNGISYSNGEPNFIRLPGYPLFLAIFYKLFDFDIQKTLWIQIILASLIPILIFFLSLTLFPVQVLFAKICAFFSAIHLGFLIFAGNLMSETLFCLFFFLFLILFLSNFHLLFCKKKIINFSYKKIFFAGFFLGIASLVRPVGQYVIVLAIILLIVSRLSFPQKIKGTLFLFSGWLVVVFAWLLRNYLLTSFIFFHTLPGKHFLNHSACYVVMNVHNLSYKQTKEKLAKELDKIFKEEEDKKNRKLNEIEKCLLTEKLAYKYLKQYPFLFLKYSISNVLKTAINPFSEELFFIEKSDSRPIGFWMPKISNKWLVPVICLDLIFLFFIWLGFVGFTINAFIIKNHLCQFLKTLPFIVLFIGITLASGFARLRLPIEPFLIILSINFWINFLHKRLNIND